MRPFTCLALILALAGAAAADDVVPAPAFEALAQGHTLYFSLDGVPFGAEQYFPGRRSLWRYEDGPCLDGRWWGEGDLICFGYDDEAASECWRFRQRPAGLSANLVEDGTDSAFELQLTRSDDAPLACPGPKVGT